MRWTRSFLGPLQSDVGGAVAGLMSGMKYGPAIVCVTFEYHINIARMMVDTLRISPTPGVIRSTVDGRRLGVEEWLE